MIINVALVSSGLLWLNHVSSVTFTKYIPMIYIYQLVENSCIDLDHTCTISVDLNQPKGTV